MVRGKTNGPSNMDIWGQDKPYYNFPDLTKWLQMKAEGGDEEIHQMMEKREEEDF
jgi:hypothetical protein